mmetsp:Transcript_48960/g.114937  ORF Transcript_48960/g.114937 Transcript_48960/m.114937 type:complete len:215 (-) Transcript_48960:1681-2325(-)
MPPHPLHPPHFLPAPLLLSPPPALLPARHPTFLAPPPRRCSQCPCLSTRLTLVLAPHSASCRQTSTKTSTSSRCSSVPRSNPLCHYRWLAPRAPTWPIWGESCRRLSRRWWRAGRGHASCSGTRTESSSCSVQTDGSTGSNHNRIAPFRGHPIRTLCPYDGGFSSTAGRWTTLHRKPTFTLARRRHPIVMNSGKLCCVCGTSVRSGLALGLGLV